MAYFSMPVLSAFLLAKVSLGELVWVSEKYTGSDCTGTPEITIHTFEGYLGMLRTEVGGCGAFGPHGMMYNAACDMSMYLDDSNCSGNASSTTSKMKSNAECQGENGEMFIAGCVDEADVPTGDNVQDLTCVPPPSTDPADEECGNTCDESVAATCDSLTAAYTDGCAKGCSEAAKAYNLVAVFGCSCTWTQNQIGNTSSNTVATASSSLAFALMLAMVFVF